MAKPILSISYLDKDLRRYIAGLLLRLRGFSAPMREIGEALIFSTDERFEKEVDPLGVPWEDISPRTRARKRAKGRGDYFETVAALESLMDGGNLTEVEEIGMLLENYMMNNAPDPDQIEADLQAELDAIATGK